MARKPMITRTQVTTYITALVANVVDRTTKEIVATYGGKFKNDDEALKYVKKTRDTETEKAIAILGKRTEKKLYGMDVQYFIEHADVIETR